STAPSPYPHPSNPRNHPTRTPGLSTAPSPYPNLTPEPVTTRSPHHPKFSLPENPHFPKFSLPEIFTTRNPRPETRDLKPARASRTGGLSTAPSPYPKPEPQNPKSGTRNPSPNPRNSRPETRAPTPWTRNPFNPPSPYPKPEPRNPKSGTRNPSPKPRNPHPRFNPYSDAAFATCGEKHLKYWELGDEDLQMSPGYLIPDP
ncbi:hypothetical protein T484DRAFT_1648771, partial [Baffinella frigidus]